MKRTLTLRRRGKFQVKTVGENHCGIYDQQWIDYSVEVVCAAVLDTRGFLFEQRNIDAFFQGIKSTNKSCEMLTQKCVRKLIDMITEENPGCLIQKITVTLSPAPHAADMTYCEEFDTPGVYQ